MSTYISKYFSYLNYVVYTYVLISFALFIYFNWEYLASPEYFQYYHSNGGGGLFALGNDDLAIFKEIGFYLPWRIILVLQILHWFVFFNLLRKSKQLLTSYQFLFFIVLALLCFIYDLLISSFFVWYSFLTPFLITNASIVFFAIKDFKEYRNIFIQILVGGIVSINFLILYFQMFFD